MHLLTFCYTWIQNTMNNNTTSVSILPITPWERLQLHPSIIVFCVLLLVVGIPGNCLILYIYSKKIKINIFGFFIKILAALDLINSVGIIPAFCVSKITPGVNASLMCKYLTWFHYFNTTITGTLYAVIAMQRYRKICRPHGSQFTEVLAKKLTIGCIIFCVVTGFPIVLILTDNKFLVEWVTLQQTGFVEVPICDFTKTSKELKLSLAFSAWMFLFLVTIIVSLVVLYSLIIHHLRLHALNKVSANRLPTSNTTSMFFSLTVIYLITVIPRVVQAVYFSLTPKLPHLAVSKLQIFDVVIQLPYVNCLVNPFIYGFSSRRFRRETFSVLCGGVEPNQILTASHQSNNTDSTDVLSSSSRACHKSASP
ncbi:C5a anaphylatoxin chemotactic receptor 1-like [Haliotis asinina]|uniref:C5a anaphylatoxin chemotactic receptor 1-like n=1 Tax=Haliotis asinina TaxID=109174 RepID=UPI003531C3E0